MRAEDILRKRRDRAIAIILNVKERDVDPHLTASANGASSSMRKVVLDQLNDFCDMALDIVASSDASTYEFNPEVWIPKIQGQLDEIQRIVMAGQGGG